MITIFLTAVMIVVNVFLAIVLAISFKGIKETSTVFGLGLLEFSLIGNTMLLLGYMGALGR